MSLRSRLTILYTTLTGGILIIFGVLVFVLLDTMLVNQADNLLKQTVVEVLDKSQVNQVGELGILELPSLELTSGVYIQIWNKEDRLTAASPGLSMMKDSLDPSGKMAPSANYNDVIVNGVHLRVLSVPFSTRDGFNIGVIQAATPLTLVDSIRILLFYILGVLTVISMVVAAIASWISIGRALAPLKTATETADQIIHADDLSRRIPYEGPTDEIGMLIDAFNSTLERLENLFSSQQRFLADVSHELRTPLTVIKGNVDLIRKLGPDDESLDSIKDEIDRLNRLVGDLLLLAKAESGKLPLNLSNVELDTLLLEVFNEMRVLAGGKVNLKLEEIDQAVVSGDRDRLKQVFINLISNAIHYTPAGGNVFLSLAKTDEMAQVTVKDTGPGIPTKDLPHIFDRFYRGEKSRPRSKSTGFGLGLSIAYWIIDMHQGSIEVDSTVGVGTTFTIRIPLLETIADK
jgi:two-component system OmpR family sensor kinase